MIEYLDKITTFCKNLKKGIINFWIWKKIIYEDRNWDQFYIYQILQFKLRIQAKYFKKRNFYVGELRDAEIMELCDRLIEKLKTEFYEMEYYDYKKRNQLKEYFLKYPKIYQETKKENPNISDKRIAYYMGYKVQNKARKTLFNVLEKNIENWWD
jgi:hypothetical protein